MSSLVTSTLARQLITNKNIRSKLRYKSFTKTKSNKKTGTAPTCVSCNNNNQMPVELYFRVNKGAIANNKQLQISLICLSRKWLTQLSPIQHLHSVRVPIQTGKNIVERWGIKIQPIRLEGS